MVTIINNAFYVCVCDVVSQCHMCHMTHVQTANKSCSSSSPHQLSKYQTERHAGQMISSKFCTELCGHASARPETDFRLSEGMTSKTSQSGWDVRNPTCAQGP